MGGGGGDGRRHNEYLDDVEMELERRAREREERMRKLHARLDSLRQESSVA